MTDESNVLLYIQPIYTLFKKLRGGNYLCFEFSTTVRKNGPKNGPNFKKIQKMIKPIFKLLGDPI